MAGQERTSRVLMSLVVSMTIGAIILMALDNQSLSGGAFSLASYTSLSSPEQVVCGGVSLQYNKWSRIRIYYSDDSTEALAALIGLNSSQEVNSHFVVHNGRHGEDGFIQSTGKWRSQQSCVSGQDWYADDMIRICVLSSGATGQCSDCQIKRTGMLIETLSRKFNIPTEQISYPINWQL